MTQGTKIENAPTLDHDVMMAKRFGSQVGPRMKLERRIVWNLLRHLHRGGCVPYTVAGGDDGNEPVKDALEAMNLVFNLDEACIGFVVEGNALDEDNEVGNVVLVFGEGIECVSDWRWNDDIVGRTFNRIMEKFNAEDYA